MRQPTPNRSTLRSSYEINGRSENVGYKDDLWSEVFVKELVVTQLVNKLPTFYETRKLFTAFTSACHWTPVLNMSIEPHCNQHSDSRHGASTPILLKLTTGHDPATVQSTSNPFNLGRTH
jgi:hypothetical protein